MDKYDRCAAALMELGDSIIEEKKKKSALIRRVSFSVSGLCAAALLCFGIWKTPALQKPPEIPQVPEIAAVTTAAAETSAPAKSTACMTTAAEVKTTRTSDNSASGVQTTAAASESRPVSTHTAPVNTAVQQAAQTGAVETIVTAASTAPVQTTQAAEETTQAVTTEKQSSPADGESAPSQQESPVEAEEPGTEGYNYFTMDELGGTYILTSSIDPAFVDDHIKNTVLTGTSSQGEIQSRAAIYSVQGIAPEVMTAVTFGSQDSYSVYCNYSYKPATLGEFMEAAGITRYASLDKAYYYDLSNGYEERYYTGIDTQKVIDMLLGCSGAECYSYSEVTSDKTVSDLTLICDMSSALPMSRAFGINRRGYVTTNLTSGGLAFNIGADKAEEIIRMITDNYGGTVTPSGEDGANTPV